MATSEDTLRAWRAARARKAVAGSAQFPPNLLEKAAAAVGEAPVLGDILGYLGRFGNVGMSALSALQSLIAGEPERAGERAMMGLRTARSLLPFSPEMDPLDYLDPDTVLSDFGVEGDLGAVEIPVLGAFTGRGLLKFGLAVATDPLVYTRLGGLTKAGKAKKAAGGSVGALTEEAANALKLKWMKGERIKPPLPFETAVKQGERALMTFGGKTVLRDIPLGGERTLSGALSRANVLARTKVFPRFVTKSGTHLDTVPDRTAMSVGKEVQDISINPHREIRARIVELGKKEHADNPGLYASEDAALLASFDKWANAVERGGDPAVHFEIAAKNRKAADKIREQLDLTDEEVTAARGRGGKDAGRTRVMVDEPSEAATVRMSVPRLGDIEVRYDPNLTSEAQHGLGGHRIVIGPKFFNLDEGGRVQVLIHEIGHELSDIMLKDGSAFKLHDDGAFRGTFTDDSGKTVAVDGINGQTTPGENVAEAYALLNTEPEWLQQHYPRAYSEVSRRAIKEKFPVADSPVVTRSTIENPTARDKAAATVARLEDEARALEMKHRIKTGDVERVRALVKQYTDEGFSRKEAWEAAHSVVLYGAHPDWAPFGARSRDIYRVLLKNEIDAGVAIQALHDPGVFYLTHWVKPESLKLMGKKSRRQLHRHFNEWWGGNPSSIRRKSMYRGSTLNEMNDWGRTHIPELKAAHEKWVAQGSHGPDPSNIFENDPLRLAVERGRRYQHSVTAARSLEEALKTYGIKASELTPEQIAGLLADGWQRADAIVARTKLRTHAGKRGEAVNPAERKAVWESVVEKKEHPGTVGPGAPEMEAIGAHPNIDLPARDIQATVATGEAIKELPTKLAIADDLLIHPEIARAMDVSLSRYLDPGTPNALMNLLDKATQPWKAAMTAYWPEFHVRNFLSNLWANYLGGVMHPVAYWRAHAVMRDFAKTGGTRAWEWAKGMTSKEIVETMDRGGALGFGHTLVGTELRRGSKGKGASLAEAHTRSPFGFEPLSRGPGVKGAIATAAHEIGPSVAFATATGNPFALLLGTKLGRNFGQLLENNAKIAHVVDKLSKGWAIDEAIFSAKKYLFDYGDLTPLERLYLRRLVPFYCVPDDCEILTRRGWVRVDDLRVGEDVLSLDHATGRSEWAPCLDKATFRYEGPIMALRSERDDFLFTVDHRWPVITHTDERQIRRGYKLRSNHRIPRVSEFGQADSIATSREAAIVGWIVTDGYMRRRGSHVEMMIYQSPKKHLAEILDLLGDDGHPGAPHPDSGVVCVRVTGALRKRIAELLPSRDRIVEFVCALSREAAEACYDAMLRAEGTITESYTHFAQQDQRVLDAFQILAQLVGKVAHISSRGAYVSGTTCMKVAGKIGTSYYSGRVWCPKTAHGTWFMRRHGRCIWTGNTWTRKNLPLQLESLVTQPGKFAIMDHLQKTASDDPIGLVDRAVIPEWMRRRWFSAQKNDDDSISVLAGLGMGFEDLSIFDRPLPEFLSMLNPYIKGVVQHAVNRDFWRDLPLDRSEVAPGILRHLPDAFLEHIGFRGVENPRNKEVMFYRADPKWLNWMRSMVGVGALSRFAATAERFEQATKVESEPSPLVKHYLSLREAHITPTDQAINLLHAERSELRDQLGELRAKGVAEISDRYYVERDMKRDPRAKDVKSINARIYKINALLQRLYRQKGKEHTEEAAAWQRQRTFRSGGR